MIEGRKKIRAQQLVQRFLVSFGSEIFTFYLDPGEILHNGLIKSLCVPSDCYI